MVAVSSRFTVLAVLAALSSLFHPSSPTLSPRFPAPLPRSLIPRSVDNLCPPTAKVCGGRKVALVIDSSGSNVDTDPDNLRIAAAEDIANRLISASEATNDAKADKVAVIDFDDIAKVVYPLGDPAGANFTGIDSDGGTYIADGIQTGADAITGAGAGSTSGTSGMVVLTDGQDTDEEGLISQISSTGNMGIRVHFGFLDPTGEASQDPDLLSAILGTGGIYGTMSDPQAQKNFVNLIYSQGLTAQDNPDSNGTSALLPGLSVARLIDAAKPVHLTYQGLAGESVNFTVGSLSGQVLTSTLSDGKKQVATSTTSDAASLFGGGGVMSYDLKKASKLTLEVHASSGSGVMTVLSLSNMPNATRPLDSAAMAVRKTNPLMLVGMSLFCLVFAGTMVIG